ncbi:MAG: hypothetical protein ACOYD6_09080, partial [Limnochordia bacterium]
ETQRRYRLKKKEPVEGAISLPPLQTGYAAGKLAYQMLTAAEEYICQLVSHQTRLGFRQALMETKQRERPS